jgi:hypothetical protein
MPGALLILQAGAAAVLAPPATPPASSLPTIEFRARVHADSLRVERRGDAHLTVTADPLLAKAIDVRPSKPVPNGVTVRDVDVQLDVFVTVDPSGGQPAATASLSSSTGEPQP